jgi:hypothetical protein
MEGMLTMEIFPIASMVKYRRVVQMELYLGWTIYLKRRGKH